MKNILQSVLILLGYTRTAEKALDRKIYSIKRSCYRRTKNGFIREKYSHMRGRVRGINNGIGEHRYVGLYLIPREVFYNWAWNDPEFNRLFDDWVKSGYVRTLNPSVDRIDSSRGYHMDNIRWLTTLENCRLGGISSAKRTKRDSKGMFLKQDIKI